MADHGQVAGPEREEDDTEQQAEDEALGEAGQAHAGHDGDEDGAVRQAEAAPQQHDPLGDELEPDIDDDAADHERRQQPKNMRSGPDEAGRH